MSTDPVPRCCTCGRDVTQTVLERVVPSAPTRWRCSNDRADGCAVLVLEDSLPLPAYGPLLARYRGLPDLDVVPWLGEDGRGRDALRRSA